MSRLNEDNELKITPPSRNPVGSWLVARFREWLGIAVEPVGKHTIRCRTGDIAMLIRPAERVCRKTGARYLCVRAGAMVQVGHVYFKDGLAFWSLKEPIHYEYTNRFSDRKSGWLYGIADIYLLPLRPSEEDGRADEFSVKPGASRAIHGRGEHSRRVFAMPNV